MQSLAKELLVFDKNQVVFSSVLKILYSLLFYAE